MNVEAFTGRESEMLLREKPAAGNTHYNICFGKEVRSGQAVILKSLPHSPKESVILFVNTRSGVSPYGLRSESHKTICSYSTL